jgi:hypothetical protein
MLSTSAKTALWELDQFFMEKVFMEKGSTFQTLQKPSDRFQENGIDYGIVEGITLFFHGYQRSTQDIDILLTKNSLSDFQKKFIDPGFTPMFPRVKKTFQDTEINVRVKFLVAGEFPGDGKPKPISFPDPGLAFIEVNNLRIINLKNLIELKRASELSAPARLKDLADVQELIRVLNLPEVYGEQLDHSVRPEFYRLWVGAAQSQDSPVTESDLEYE